MDCNVAINKLNWETPLFYACKTGKLAVVQLMIENYQDWGIDCNRANVKGQNILMVAMEKGHVDLVRMLVGKSSEIDLNLDAYDLDENTALMIGSKNKQTKAIQALFEKDKRWCSTKVDANGNHVTGQDEYGFCSPDCPIHVESKYKYSTYYSSGFFFGTHNRI